MKFHGWSYIKAPKNLQLHATYLFFPPESVGAKYDLHGQGRVWFADEDAVRAYLVQVKRECEQEEQEEEEEEEEDEHDQDKNSHAKELEYKDEEQGNRLARATNDAANGSDETASRVGASSKSRDCVNFGAAHSVDVGRKPCAWRRKTGLR